MRVYWVKRAKKIKFVFSCQSQNKSTGLPASVSLLGKRIGSNRHPLDLSGGAPPFPMKDLEVRDAISIPTAPTKPIYFLSVATTTSNKSPLSNNWP